ncbi:hypothetical protein LSCM1_07865 [Leishmania martiniquensis]|uniref:Uncharacterized protein n=1 Tax=Leishmania martiniquensis TaxID=1580590 RepID=A0A836H487_9TRYP|nr:hypothetical protein LSCM1_07865 [Leishmania martiniquensis]
MPPKRKESSTAAETGRSAATAKRRREGQRRDFASSALHLAFEAHVTGAQDAFLRGDSQTAEREAVQALRIRPTTHLFALLAVIAESKGKFDKASDLRLLQAFLARDIVLWEELLHDFMTQQLYYKSVVCLQRMSALEKNPQRYRALQLQLADLLIGLGEIRRASNVLVPLWNSSRCRDFEVFALLSSLYFQLGKWASLQRLIESSIKHAFQLPPAAGVAGATKTLGEALGHGAEATAQVPPSASTAQEERPTLPPVPSTAGSRIAKRVRFVGMGIGESGAAASVTADLAGHTAPTLVSPTEASLDEFSFDDVASPASQLAHPPSSCRDEVVASSTYAHQGGVVHQLYGERIELHTPQDQKNFLTLLNVHAELLNEQGSFSDTVQLLHMAAGCLDVDLMELPPDLLVRLGVAYAFLGGVYEQPCRDVFQHLMEYCSMEDFGDVLLDAAMSLQKVSMHEEAAQLYVTLTRYHQFAYDRARRQVSVAEAELALMQDTAPLNQVQAATDALKALKAEEADLKTVLAAALQGQAQSAYARELYEEAKGHAERVRELEPLHLHARLLLGRYYFYQRKDTATAVEVLTPSKHEPALQRIQLGVFLVHVFQRAKRYVEAIALGVSIFEMLLSSEEDGDTLSVAPGASSRRSGASLYLPTMTRASSAIIPASSLAGMVSGSASVGSSNVVARTSFSLAVSIKASTSVARQQLARRGLESLTTTVYGASAAASLAAGWDRREEEQQQLKDTSTIFRFNRRRRRPAVGTNVVDGDSLTDKASQGLVGEGGEQGGDATVHSGPGAARLKTAEERREAVIRMEPAAFWPMEEEEGESGGAEDNQPASSRAKTEAGKSSSAQPMKEAAGDDEGYQSGTDSPCPSARHDRGGTRVSDTTTGETGVVAASARVVGKGTGKRMPKKSGGGGAVGHSSSTTVGERDRDLAELEGFLTSSGTNANAAAAMVEPSRNSGEAGMDPVRDEHQDDDAVGASPESYELPSLEEVSKQFQDPLMAQLFLEASSFTPGGGVRGGEGQDSSPDPWASLAEASHNACAAVGLPDGTGPADKVTLREAIAVLGKAGFISLAVAIVECYSAVGQFTEAREFAFVSLTHFAQKRRLRQMGNGLERPLRLALLRAALAAGESEDAYRVGLRLLQQDTSEDKRHEVVELMHSVLNRCYDRSSILYRAVADGYNDPALLVLLANRYHQTRSYTRVLNLYLMALRERPADILLNFMVGLSYLFCSHRKRTRSREACVSAAIYYLTQYQRLRLALEPAVGIGEVLYNIARALQFLKLYYLSIPLYERVAYDLCAPEECTIALQRAARVNLYFVYRWAAGNRTLALTALQPRRWLGGTALASQRRPSPFRLKTDGEALDAEGRLSPLGREEPLA